MPDGLQQWFVIMEEPVSAGAHQSPDVIPVQWPLTGEPMLRVLVDTLEDTASQVVRHGHTSPGHLGDNVPDDAQGDTHIVMVW